MRNDIRQRIVSLITEYRDGATNVNYKEFIQYLKESNEFSMRAHVIANKYKFGSMVRESLDN